MPELFYISGSSLEKKHKFNRHRIFYCCRICRIANVYCTYILYTEIFSSLFLFLPFWQTMEEMVSDVFDDDATTADCEKNGRLILLREMRFMPVKVATPPPFYLSVPSCVAEYHIFFIWILHQRIHKFKNRLFVARFRRNLWHLFFSTFADRTKLKSWLQLLLPNFASKKKEEEKNCENANTSVSLCTRRCRKERRGEEKALYYASTVELGYTGGTTIYLLIPANPVASYIQL